MSAQTPSPLPEKLKTDQSRMVTTGESIDSRTAAKVTGNPRVTFGNASYFVCRDLLHFIDPMGAGDAPCHCGRFVASVVRFVDGDGDDVMDIDGWREVASEASHVR